MVILAEQTWLASTGHWLAILLWIGFGSLTIALLVLMRTHLGHARPISKCVALSVFAHLLLATYAYSTRLIIETPGQRNASDPVKISFVSADESTADSSAEADSEPDSPSPAETTFVDAAPWQDPVPDLPEPLPAPLQQPTPPPPEVDEPPIVPPAEKPPVETLAELLPEAPPVDAPPPESTATAPPEEPSADEPVTAAPADAVVESAEPPVPKDAGPSAELPSPAPTPEPATLLEQVAVTAETRPARASQPTFTQTPRRPGDGAAVPEVYRGRLDQERLQLALANGGNERTEAAIENALAWLAAHQSADGRWNAAAYGAGQEQKVLGHDRQGAGADADTGITGLALLSFLGAGHTHFAGPYRQQVQRGLEFLLAQQTADGCLAGEAQVFSAMYCHGIAFLALSESYAMTGDQRLRRYVELAQHYTLQTQIPHDGGWRYQRGDTQGDMSQFGWQVMALRSAELGGIPIPPEAERRMLVFLQNVSSGQFGGKASYRVGTRPSRTMTAEALACRFFLQAPLRPGQVEEASQFLLEEPPGADLVNLYYWYYATLALHQLQGPRWETWNARLQEQLLARQELQGPQAGSWAPHTVWGGYGGRVYSTAMATLSLEVYYRYLPMYSPSQERTPPLEEAGRFVPRLRR